MDVKKRIVELEEELQKRQENLQKAQGIVQRDLQTIVLLNGGIAELKNFLDKEEEEKAKKVK